ncbi:hypothetical protein A3C23_04825 [Candidatus Roizmanbacteria bacterium RIFCSPHIGHO2_02_FULL_37_13b]|uniref:Cohesin domain-containing protein n=1 Tax=Candidatus Roizmanbacteria bacterium RIFCSPLOWO2_02_FULL_36_11 TaxID=1802071 RepID=A0A1F7JID6_9BACT|nr:MAG: hypothetical protein A3C23_04825 [Candidatus Roizmanbacteria bacterium RIFCSPHIGHO2_02_FULL_37_13b]OGK55369.1 MAG: hypothetical protein A3H78_03640 [Candidatus Roizmanbacteria bacterium RIFCSPLOWO2_02_FULL_36_11]
MSKARLVIIGIVFIFSVAFFLLLLKTTVFKTQAAEDPVYIFFDKDVIKTAELTDTQTPGSQPQIPVNIYFQTKPENKISAGSVQLKYDPMMLTVLSSTGGQIETTCKNNDQSLITQAKFTNDSTAGVVTISNVLLDNDNTKLPPHLPSGIFCMTTVYFQPKFNPLLSAAKVTTVSLMTDPASCEVVGPSKTYGCNFYADKKSITIDLNNILPTPSAALGVSPTPTQSVVVTSAVTPTEGVITPTVSLATPSATPATTTPPPLGGASYKFIPTTVKTGLGGTFEIAIDVDSGKYKLVGADLFLKYDSTKLAVQQVKSGNFFEFATSDLSVPGSAYVVGVVTNLDQLKSGRGTLATLVVKPLTLGNSTMTVQCTQGQTNDSNIVDGNAEDVINCSLNETVSVNVSDTVQITPSVSVIPSITTPNPTSSLCLKKTNGDCNCSDNIDIVDFEFWRKEYAKELSSFSCDFNNDKNINLTDFNIWRVGYFKDKAVTVTPNIPVTTLSASPSALPIISPTGSIIILQKDEI